MGKRGSKSFKKKVDSESKHIHDEQICDEFCQLRYKIKKKVLNPIDVNIRLPNNLLAEPGATKS